MKEIKLTGTLKTYKAIVIHPGEEIPCDYEAVSGYTWGQDEYQIALPIDLKSKTDIWDRLVQQAGDVLFSAMLDDIPED